MNKINQNEFKNKINLNVLKIKNKNNSGSHFCL